MLNFNSIQKQGVVKFDPLTAKTLPISTNRKRTKGWEVEREYNGLVMAIQAFESLNAYDLIALFQMLDDYSKNFDKWENRGMAKFSINDDFERTLMYRKFDLKFLCKQRNILTKKINRKSIAESFDRWYKAEIIYKKPNDVTKTRYIYEFKIDKNYEYVEIIANSNFLNFCLQNGMAMNWERLTKYGKNYYALQLDIYLQFRAIKYGKKTKKYKYPNTIKEETLFNHLGVENEIKDLKHKREKIKEAFAKFKEITHKEYVYDAPQKKWIKKTYLEYINKKY
jgi:hypothetical protein